MRLSYVYIKDKLHTNIGAFNTLWLFVKFISNLISIKIVAIFLGPEGMVFVGNLRNLLTTIRTLSILGMYDAVVHHISVQKRHKEEITKVLSTTYYIGYVVTLILAFVIYNTANYWNTFIFSGHYQYTYVFEAIAIALPLYATNALCMAIIKGFSKKTIYIIITIISNLLGLLITLLLITEMKLEGAFLAIVLNPAISLLITIIIIINQRNLMKLLWADKVSLHYIKKFIPYIALGLASTLLIPVTLILIRNHLITTDGITNTGYWEAMQRISDQYTYCIIAMITIYLTSRFAKINKGSKFRKEILSVYKIILPLMFSIFLIVYASRTLWIKILFSDDFLKMESLFIWQLIGDFFKIAAMIITYILIVKKKYWIFVSAKLALFVLLYCISLYYINQDGFIGASIGHCISYILYFAITLLLCRNFLFNPPMITTSHNEV